MLIFAGLLEQTAADRLIVALLSVMGGVDGIDGNFTSDALASAMFKAKTNWIVNLGPTEMVRGDQKDFKSGEWKLGISVSAASKSPVTPELSLARELTRGNPSFFFFAGAGGDDD